MFKHIVMWRVAGDSPADKSGNAQAVKREFEALAGKVPDLVSVEVGINVCHSEAAQDVVLITCFADRAAYQGYTVHPAHLAVRQRLEGRRLDRVEVDYETSTSE